MPRLPLLETTLAILCTITAFGAPKLDGTRGGYGSIPLYFEINQGQSDARTRFLARSAGFAAFFDDEGFRLSAGKDAISMRIAGAAKKPHIQAEQQLEGISNYYLGGRAITGAPHYRRVRAYGVRPGMDVVYYGQSTQLEYDLVFQPGVDPSGLRLTFSTRPEITEAGDVLVRSGGTEFRQHKPVAWQIVGDERHVVECRYAITATGAVRLVLGKFDRNIELIVDPILSYSTYLGGTGDDRANGIAIDSSHSTYIAGQTTSSDFPVTSGSKRSNTDAFVTKLTPDGTSLIYSTFIGGSYEDYATAIALDANGNAYITGSTYSSDFAASGFKGYYDAFIAKLGPAGTVVYATLLGGTSGDYGLAVAVDDVGQAYIAGYTSSTGIATTGAFRTTLGDYQQDGFVARFSTAGTIQYCTYLGGSQSDYARGIAVDARQYAYVTGETSSSNFPVTANALMSTFGGGSDAFVTVLNSTGTGLIYSSYLGGSGSDSGNAITRDINGNVYVAGRTQSNDFPTQPGSFATVRGSSYYYYDAAFVSKFNVTQLGQVWSAGYSTYLCGADNSTLITSIAVDVTGQAFVTGQTSSSSFPTTPGAIKASRSSPYYSDNDMFLAELDVTGASLIYSTLLGGTGTDYAAGLALDGNGGAYVAGYTSSATFPTTPNAYQATSPKAGSGSSYSNTAVISKIDTSSPVSCAPQISPASASVAGRGGSASFNLTLAPGCPWEAVTSSSIKINGATRGMGSSSNIAFSLTISSNDSTYNTQTSTVQIGTATFTVNQSAWSCTDPVIAPSSLAFDPAGGIRTLALKLPSGCRWMVTPSAPWINVTSAASGTGPTNVTIYAAPNTFTSRSGSVSIAGQSVQITQPGDGCTAVVSAGATNFGAGGGSSTMRIITGAGCSWTAYMLAPWIQLNSAFSTGQGSSTIPFSVAANPGATARTGSVLLGDQTVTFTQDAGPSGIVNSYTVTTLAGGNYGSFTGDEGPAVTSGLYSPYGLALDASGLYIADSSNSRIRRITPDGIIHTYAGGGSSSADNVERLSAVLNYPQPLTVDAATGFYYFGEYSRVRRIANGIITTVAGTTSSGFSGDNGPATSAQLYNVLGVVADSSSNLYIADYSNGRIRKVSGGIITTFAGGGTSIGDGGDPLAARMGPTGIAIDRSGAIYISDSTYGRIRKVSGGIIQTIAGGGSSTADGIPATTASISSPGAIAVDDNGSIYFAHSSGISKIGTDGLIRLIAQYSSTRGILVDSDGSILFSDSNSSAVRRLTPTPVFCNFSVGNAPSQPIAGGSFSIAITAPSTCAWKVVDDPNYPWITVTSGQGSGNGNVTLSVAANPGAVRTATILVAGQPVTINQGGTGTSVQFVKFDNTTKGSWVGTYGHDGYQVMNYSQIYPAYVAPVASGGALFTWNASTTDARAPQLASSDTQRFAGTMYSSSSFTIDLPFNDSQLHQFAVYCLDWDQLGRSQTLQILDANLNVLDSRIVSGFVNGTYVVWNIAGRVKLRVVRGAGPNAVISGMFFGGSGLPPFTVAVSPASVSLGVNQQQTFTALVNTVNAGVTWSLSPNVGTISSSGFYTAPATISSQQNVTVVATSQADGVTTGTATISLIPSGGPSSGTAQYVKADTTTQGTWIGTYGGDGYYSIDDSISNPSYVVPAPTGNSAYRWAYGVADVRALQQANGSSRTAAVWYSSSTFTVDLTMSGGTHQLAVYCLDWDNLGRIQNLEIVDTNGTVLDIKTLSNFGSGAWLVWNISGHVQLRVTKIVGANAVISGLFFGGAGVVPVSVTVTPGTATLTAGATRTFAASVLNTSNTAVTWSISPSVGSINQSGVYTAPATITPTQTVTVTATSQADATKHGDATITLQSAISGTSAQFVKQDTGTQGTWKGVYGSDGYWVVGSGLSHPIYSTPSPSGNGTYTWASSTTDVRALQQYALSSRTAGVWYSTGQMFVDVPAYDTQIHQIAVYCLDWDNVGRAERLEILDTANTVLDAQNVSNFGNGVWLVWNVRGHVQLRITRTAGMNAVVSGLFFDAPSTASVGVTVSPTSVALSAGQSQTFLATVSNSSNSSVTWSISPNIGSINSSGVYTAPSTISAQQTVTVTATNPADSSKSASAAITLLPSAGSSASAVFVRQDLSTYGNWKGVFGTDGYNVIGNASSNPSYVTPVATGNSIHTWVATTTDGRALVQASSSNRIAGAWYTATSFVVDLPVTDIQSHQFAVYCLDWDNLGRIEKLEILDASNNVLDTRIVSAFGNGIWMVWNISGHVQLRVTRASGVNAVISGLFFK